MPGPVYLPQTVEAATVGMLEQDLEDLLRVFVSTDKALTDDIYAAVVTAKIVGTLASDPDPAKATYRVQVDVDLYTLADRENEGEDFVLGKIHESMWRDAAPAQPVPALDALGDYVVLDGGTTDTTIEVEGRRTRRLSFTIAVTPSAS